MDNSKKRNNSKASKVNDASKKNAEVSKWYPVGGVDPQVFESYIHGFPDLVEETGARPKKATTKSKNSKQSVSITLELPTNSAKSKKASTASAKTQSVAANGKNRKVKDNKEERSISPTLNQDDLDSFALLSQLLDRPYLPDKAIDQSKKKSSTKQVATNWSLRSSNKLSLFDDERIASPAFSIYSLDWYVIDKDYYDSKLSAVLRDFEIPRAYRRDGNERLFYNYLLLDSRKCRDSRGVSWESFIDAVFYLGKGKNARSKSHTKAAEEYYSMNKATSSRKIQKILEIWKAGYPVLLLEFARNIISEEAYTREALMIEAIGKECCCNAVRGTCYGLAELLKPIEKRRLGALVLMEARKCFVVEGAREEFPKLWKEKPSLTSYRDFY